MLPDLYRDRYTHLQNSLQQVQTTLAQPSPSSTDLRSDLLMAQQTFQDILALDLDGVAIAEQSRLQSWQTEINRELRLLSVDATFLQAARQSSTAHQRQQQMGDRVTRLLQFCGEILKS